MFVVTRNRVCVVVRGGARQRSVFSAETILHPDSITKTMSKFRGMRPVRQQTVEPAKRAAVLIPICRVNGKMSLLFTLRTSRLRSHRGQVSFPGGMQDLHDRSLEATALRETREELGIREDQIQVWGAGNVIVGRGDTSILPVVGRILNEKINEEEEAESDSGSGKGVKEKGKIKGKVGEKRTLDEDVFENFALDRLRVNTDEVQEVFTVSLEDLCDSTKIGHTQFRESFSSPVFSGGKFKVWGLTGVITNIFLRALLPVTVYKHRIAYVPSANPAGATKQQEGVVVNRPKVKVGKENRHYD